MSKKTRWITIGITIIVIVAVVWLFMRLFGSSTPNADDGEFERVGFFSFFGGAGNPDDSSDFVDPTPLNPLEGLGNPLDNDSLPRLRQLTREPTAGITFGEKVFEVTGATSSFVRYIERATGHIFDAYTDTVGQERVSNTTIPKIQHMIWGDTDHPVIQYLRDTTDIVETFVGEIIPPESLTSTSTNNVNDVMVGNLGGSFCRQTSPASHQATTVVVNLCI